MDSTEPAMIDNHGARWKSTNTYELVPSAVRYQKYERSFSAQVSTFTPGIQINIPWIKPALHANAYSGMLY